MLAMSDELAIALVISAVAFIGFGFLIVLTVRSVPNKLLLLGLLMTIASVVFGAILTSAATLAIAMMIPAIVLILIGAICRAIDFVAKLVISDKKDQSPV